MPYNPSSAYPCHSTYTPPTEGRGFARAINEVDWGKQRGGFGQVVMPDMGHALRAAAHRDTGVNRQIQEMVNRKGLISAGLGIAGQRAQERYQTTRSRKLWNRAEHGDDPNEIAEQVPTEIDTRTPEGRAAAAKIWPGGAGGREHVAPVNDRLDDFAARETRTTGVEKAAAQIMNSTMGGPMQAAVNYVFGSARSRLRGE